MDDFTLIYRILRFLDAMMKCDEFDKRAFTPEHYGISVKQWANTLTMLIERGYIDGVSVDIAADGSPMVSRHSPRLTLTGLEYLRGNEFMRKEAKAAKGES